MKPYNLHPESIVDVDEIWSYIAEDNPVAADRVREKLWSEFQSLADNPYTGHTREDLTARPLRFRRVYRYLIAYACEDVTTVIAVLHGSRDPDILAAILRGRETIQ